jgi:hypothetical protein
LYYMYLCDIWSIVLYVPLWYLVQCIICTSVIFGPLYYTMNQISQRYMFYNGPNITEVHVIQWTKYHRGQCFTMEYLVHCITCTSVIFGPLYCMYFCDIWSNVLYVPLWYLVHCITCTSVIFGSLYYIDLYNTKYHRGTCNTMDQIA